MRAALVLLAACSGGYETTAPRAKPSVRLVECAPALPLFVEVDGRVTTHGRLDGEGMGWAGGPRPGSSKRAASVSLGMPQTSGMLDAMVVRKAVTTKLSDLTKCYERELSSNPAISRQNVTWRFSVAQDGRVLFADPTSHTLSTATSTCITRALRDLKFPARTTGGSITVTQPFVFDTIPLSDRPSPVATMEKVAWTPFAVGAFAPDRAATVARAAESALRSKAAKLEACFTTATSGSLRAIMGVRADGEIAASRVGGIGDAAVEQCVEKQLDGAKVLNPMGDATEIACDFARGDAQPWRVTPSESYGLIATTSKEMTFGTKRIAVGALEPDALPGDKTYLIVVDPRTPGSLLSNALAWASEGDASLVALADGKRPPLYLGMGRVGFDDAHASRPMLMLNRSSVQACVGRQTREGKLAEAGQLAQRLAKRCKSMRCGSLVVGIDDLALAKDLIEVTSAARRAGFERVLIGGRVVCEKADELEEDDP